MNEVNARRTRLQLGWVTVFGRVYSGGLRYFGPYAEINCGPNCYTIKTKNAFNQNYILNQINQFMLLYKDMVHIEHKNDT